MCTILIPTWCMHTNSYLPGVELCGYMSVNRFIWLLCLREWLHCLLCYQLLNSCVSFNQRIRISVCIAFTSKWEAVLILGVYKLAILYLYHFCCDCINLFALCAHVIYGAYVCMYTFIQYKCRCLMYSVLLSVVSRTR